ncbi:hypothetical protein ACFWNG_30225 [Streptomyces sp. NPDC058391]|uniref:hypothetical protein n=1 Tax=unclassified Streptomyces TaxID=2593676 RepID=UPI003651F863
MSRKSARLALVAAAAATITLTSAISAHADGDGDCDDTGNICVYNAQQPTDVTQGYYDLNDAKVNFHNSKWLLVNTGTTLSDTISAAYNTASAPTSCSGFTFYWDVNYGGSSYFVSRNFNAITWYEHNNEFSSFRKTGC